MPIHILYGNDRNLLSLSPAVQRILDIILYIADILIQNQKFFFWETKLSATRELEIEI